MYWLAFVSGKIPSRSPVKKFIMVLSSFSGIIFALPKTDEKKRKRNIHNNKIFKDTT